MSPDQAIRNQFAIVRLWAIRPHLQTAQVLPAYRCTPLIQYLSLAFEDDWMPCFVVQVNHTSPGAYYLNHPMHTLTQFIKVLMRDSDSGIHKMANPYKSLALIVFHTVNVTYTAFHTYCPVVLGYRTRRLGNRHVSAHPLLSSYSVLIRSQA